MLMDLSLAQVLDIWCDLEDALQGKNSYGGRVAEIYAHRLGHPSGLARVGLVQETRPATSLERTAALEYASQVAESFRALTALFERRRSAVVYIEVGRGEWQRLGVETLPAFDHRVHVRVDPAP